MNHKHIVFFDSRCRICCLWIRFFQMTDRNKVLYFAPLGGETATHAGIYETESVVFAFEGTLSLGAKAMSLIFLQLQYPLPLLGVFFRIPGAEWLYRKFARLRKCETGLVVPNIRLLP